MEKVEGMGWFSGVRARVMGERRATSLKSCYGAVMAEMFLTSFYWVKIRVTDKIRRRFLDHLADELYWSSNE